VAERHRQRVGGVIRSRHLGQPQQDHHHARDLILLRAARAADRALDLLGGVPRARHAVLAGGEHHHAAGLPDGERRAYVLPEVELLEGHRIRLVLVDQGADSGVDVSQSSLLGKPGAGLDHASVERQQTPATPRDHAVAGVCQTRIYAENDHSL
jgi:hypothetical protein